MRILDTMRKQTAVYWAPGSGRAKYDELGQPTQIDPVEIRCRWSNKVEQFIDSKGAEQISKSKVYPGIDLEPGGYLRLGTISDLDSADVNPEVIDGAWEIKAFDKIPTLKADKFLRKAFL